jgi:DNA polymerase-3 subunit alpha
MEQREYLQWERELLGIYLSSHPLKEYEKILQKLNPIGDIKPNLHDSKVTIGGSISKINSIVTKAGKKMAFVTVEDLSSEIELLVFPRVFEEYEELITQDAVVIVEGTVNSTDRDGRRTDDVKVFVDTLELARKNMKLEKREIRQKTNYKPVEKPLRVPAVKKEPKLYIHIKDPENSDALIALKKTLGGSPGVVVTVLVVGEGDKKQAIKLPFKVAVTNELKTELVDLLGEGCVVEK